MHSDISEFERIIGYAFQNIDLLRKALTHKSYADEIGSKEYNERMEFLGDSVLASAVVDYLYHKYPDQDEGKLSQLKSQLVSRQELSRWAREISVGEYIYISASEEQSGGRKRDSILADTIEAVIAAIYIDGGFEHARRFILKYYAKQRRIIITDTKSKLQEYVQSTYKALPVYKVISESGPDHEKSFEMAVYIKKEMLGTGVGRSKKEAEQAAAKNALKQLAKARKTKA